MDRDQAEQLVRWARMKILEGKSRIEIESELDEIGFYDEIRSALLDHAQESADKIKESRKILLNDGTVAQIVFGACVVFVAIILLNTSMFDHGRGRGLMISVLTLGMIAIGNGLYWRFKANNQ